MRAAYLANIRFPSERAHSAQIEAMCGAFPRFNLQVDLFVSSRDYSEKDKVNERNFAFKVIRLPQLYFNKDIKILFYLNEIFFAFFFLFKTRNVEYDFYVSRSEVLLFICTLFFCNKKILWEVHDLRENFFSKVLLKRNIKLVVTSNGLYEHYQLIGYRNILLAHNGVSEDFFSSLPSKSEVRRKMGISESDFVILYIGGFDKWKGIETFFAAADSLPNINFVAIGGSAREVQYYSSLFPKVTFLGHRPYSELKENQQIADILVVPNTAKNTLSEKFTSPLKLFAHMTSKVPLIVSDIQSIRSIVDERFVAFFKPDEVDALVESIKSVQIGYDDAVTRAKYLAKESEQYTWSSRAAKIVNFLKI